MLVADWFNYEMQTIITLLGGVHYRIWHFTGKSYHSIVSACKFLHNTTDTM